MGFIGKTYDKSYFTSILRRQSLYSQRNRNRLREILKNRRDGKLLELGYGGGYLLRLASSYFDVYGIDISEYACNPLKEIFGDKVVVGDVAEIDMREKQYDVVVAFSLLEHIRMPKVVVKKIFNSLKDGGVFIGSVGNNSPLFGRLLTLFVNYYIDRTHVSTYEPAKWKSLFHEIGFRNIFFFGEFVLTPNISFYIRKPYWKFVSHNLMFSAWKMGG